MGQRGKGACYQAVISNSLNVSAKWFHWRKSCFSKCKCQTLCLSESTMQNLFVPLFSCFLQVCKVKLGKSIQGNWLSSVSFLWQWAARKTQKKQDKATAAFPMAVSYQFGEVRILGLSKLLDLCSSSFSNPFLIPFMKLFSITFCHLAIHLKYCRLSSFLAREVSPLWAHWLHFAFSL